MGLKLILNINNQAHIIKCIVILLLYCSTVHQFEVKIEKEDNQTKLTIDNIEILRNLLNTAFQKISSMYKTDRNNYLLQINLGLSMLYKKFLKSGAYRLNNQKTNKLPDFLIAQLESALNSSDELFLDSEFKVHIIVTYSPEMLPSPKGSNAFWLTNYGSQTSLKYWKTLKTLQNTDFGFKIRYSYDLLKDMYKDYMICI